MRRRSTDGLEVDVAPPVGTTRRSSLRCWAPSPRLVIDDAPAVLTTGEACMPTPLSLSPQIAAPRR